MATQAEMEARRWLEVTRRKNEDEYAQEYLRCRRHLVAVLRSHGVDVGTPSRSDLHYKANNLVKNLEEWERIEP